MKRSINFFRIKLILIIAIIVFPIAFFVLLTAILWSGDYGEFWPSITFENAPENTAYVDILIKLPQDSEEYVDFAEWEEPPKKVLNRENVGKEVYHSSTQKYSRIQPIYEEISITPDSEIARLNADGYVSLSVHYAGSKGFQKTDLSLDYLHRYNEIPAIKKRYGKFKAAYVDENGNVLGITKVSRTRYTFKEPSSFTANGDKLIFTKWDTTLLEVLFLVTLFGEPAAIIALIVIIIIQSVTKPKPYLPPRPVCNPRSIEERNRENGEQQG